MLKTEIHFLVAKSMVTSNMEMKSLMISLFLQKIKKQREGIEVDIYK